MNKMGKLDLRECVWEASVNDLSEASAWSIQKADLEI